MRALSYVYIYLYIHKHACTIKKYMDHKDTSECSGYGVCIHPSITLIDSTASIIIIKFIFISSYIYVHILLRHELIA